MMAPCCLSTMPKENKNWIVPLAILLAISQIASLLFINYQHQLFRKKNYHPPINVPLPFQLFFTKLHPKLLLLSFLMPLQTRSCLTSWSAQGPSTSSSWPYM
jgi:hypothetical protein